MRAVLLTNDLIATAVAEGAAERCGAALAVAPDAAAAATAVEAGDVGLVLVDVRAPQLDVAELLARLRPSLAPGGKVVAFGPHVHRDLLARAKAAGCDEVITRGEFDRRIDGYLAAISQ